MMTETHLARIPTITRTIIECELDRYFQRTSQELRVLHPKQPNVRVIRISFNGFVAERRYFNGQASDTKWGVEWS